LPAGDARDWPIAARAKRRTTAPRADHIRKQLRWQLGILHDQGVKPNGMYQRTHARLLARHDALVNVALTGMAKKLGLLRGRLEDTVAEASS